MGINSTLHCFHFAHTFTGPSIFFSYAGFFSLVYEAQGCVPGCFGPVSRAILSVGAHKAYLILHNPRPALAIENICCLQIGLGWAIHWEATGIITASSDPISIAYALLRVKKVGSWDGIGLCGCPMSLQLPKFPSTYMRQFP